MTIDDLPPPGIMRWCISRKAQVVAGVQGGLITVHEACERYMLSFEEFLSWKRLIDDHGALGLPKATATDEADEEKQEAPSTMPGASETILVVEDDSDVRAFVVSALEAIGYTVIEAEDGPAALPLLDEEPHLDLLLTDVVMPGGMNGREVAKEVQKRYPGIKVLYTSGYTQDAIIHHAKLEEGVELLGKPYTWKTLARTIRRVLDQQGNAGSEKISA